MAEAARYRPADCATIAYIAFPPRESHESNPSLAVALGGWKNSLPNRIVPWVLRDIDLGSDVLEVGAGLTSDLLRARCERLTAIEIDDRLAAALEDRLVGTNVAVVRGDATTMPLRMPRSRMRSPSRCCITFPPQKSRIGCCAKYGGS